MEKNPICKILTNGDIKNLKFKIKICIDEHIQKLTNYEKSRLKAIGYKQILLLVANSDHRWRQ